MEEYTCLYKGNMYHAEIRDSVYGGNILTIKRARYRSTESETVGMKRCEDITSARLRMQEFMPDATWKEI